MENFKVFISSTRRDLLAERKAVATLLRKAELPVTAMEDWDALPGDATSVSVDGVMKCDLFVGIYAFRYGFIPPDSAKSVTEQEYDIARQEGKRCLLYFKEEKPGDPVGVDPELLEPQSSCDLLAEFKQRIELELVRGYFNSSDDLTTKLALDISRLEKGYLPGYTQSDLFNRWSIRGEAARNNLTGTFSSVRSDLLPSPLLGLWSRFTIEPMWHDEMASELRSISDLTEKVEDFYELGTRAAQLADRITESEKAATPEDYNTLLKFLNDTVTEADLAKIQDATQRLRKRIEAARRDNRELEDDSETKLYFSRPLLRHVRDLRREVRDPGFRKCFPIIGSLGSGRTHFVASLLGSVPGSWYTPESESDPGNYNRSCLLLSVGAPSMKSLEQDLLDNISQASGLKWRSLEEVDRFLHRGASDSGGSQIRLGIAIDDLHRWLQERNKFTDAVKELTDFISQHTQLRSLFWLLTIQDTAYSQISGINNLLQNYSFFRPDPEEERAREFQRRTSYATLATQISGWLSLDDLNREKEFGLKLIGKGLQAEGASLPSPELLSDNQSVYRNLVKPFIACVLLDLHFSKLLNLEHLATLSYMSFVEEFWNKRKDEFVTEYQTLRRGDGHEILHDDWSQALKFIAQTLSQTGDFKPRQKDLEKQVIAAASQDGQPSPERMAASAISALVKSGFLKPYKTPDPQMPEYEVEKIGFEIEPFWELRLASHIRAWPSIKNHDEKSTKAELLNWFGVVESNEIEEGVLEFLLLLLDDEAAKAEADTSQLNFVHFLQRLGIDSPELPEEAVWFFGANATFKSQQALLELVGSRQNRESDRRVLHSLMYFLVEALPGADQPARRFELLQPYYAEIGSNGLSAYFLYIARRLINQARDNKALAAAMNFLNKSEPMGISQRLAWLTVRALFANAEEDFGDLDDAACESILKIVLNYLQVSVGHAEEEYHSLGERKRWERVFYREWVLRFFCTQLVDLKGVDAYSMLATNHWYEPRKVNIPWPISVEMHREANFALGDWYRIPPSEEKTKQYLGLIDQLANSHDFRERETAFYLIRHSRPTHGERGSSVDPIFRPLLAKIFLDPKLSKTVTRFYELFRVNLPDFASLEARRERNMKGGDRPSRFPAGKPKKRKRT